MHQSGLVVVLTGLGPGPELPSPWMFQSSTNRKEHLKVIMGVAIGRAPPHLSIAYWKN